MNFPTPQYANEIKLSIAFTVHILNICRSALSINFTDEIASNADPDQTALCYEQPDLGLHCLPNIVFPNIYSVSLAVTK